MPEYTANYNLIKPQRGENANFCDINDLNNNADVIDAEIKRLSDTKTDKVEGKGLSTEDYTTAEKTKLAGIAVGANNYIHPDKHPWSMITGAPTSYPAQGGTATKVSHKLTVGSKTYDGSAAVTLTASDLEAAPVSHTHMSIYTAILTESGWSASAPYVQTVTITGILASDRPKAGPVLSENADTATDQKEAWGCISNITTAANSIIARCLEEKPMIDIPIQLEVTR